MKPPRGLTGWSSFSFWLERVYRFSASFRACALDCFSQLRSGRCFGPLRIAPSAVSPFPKYDDRIPVSRLPESPQDCRREGGSEGELSGLRGTSDGADAGSWGGRGREHTGTSRGSG